MIGPLGLTELQLLALVAVFYVLSCAQLLDACIAFNQRRDAHRGPLFAYRILLAVHFILMASLANSACHSWSPPSFGLWAICPDLNMLLAFDALIAAFGLVMCLASRRPSMLCEVAILVVATPFGLEAVGRVCPAGFFMIAEAAFFVFWRGSSLAIALKTRGRHLSITAPIDVVQTMPDGLAFLRPLQTVSFANDAMRLVLARLGISADYSTSEEVLEKIASAPGAWLAVDSGTSASLLDDEASKVITFGEDETVMFSTYKSASDPGACVLVAMDVTLAWRQQAQESAVRAQMEKTEIALRNLLRETESLAQKKSVAKMRTVVHDIMGQRLSILHRLLEGELSGERIVKMVDTIRTMMEDIEKTGQADPARELESIVEAFACVGVRIEVEGELPADAVLGRVLVSVIRESATNAVRHSQAQTVKVLMATKDDALIMSVASAKDPAFPEAPDQREGCEGHGIKGMREALASVGGTLEIVRDSAFRVIARVSLSGAGGADAPGLEAAPNRARAVADSRARTAPNNNEEPFKLQEEA